MKAAEAFVFWWLVGCGCVVAAVVLLLAIPPIRRATVSRIAGAFDRAADRRLRQLGALAVSNYQRHLDDSWSLHRDEWRRELQQPDTERPA